MGMALLGDKISAEQALQWGMIWQVTENEELTNTTQQLAQHLATQPTYGLGLIKRLFMPRQLILLMSNSTLSATYSALAGEVKIIAKELVLFK